MNLFDLCADKEEKFHQESKSDQRSSQRLECGLETWNRMIEFFLVIIFLTALCGGCICGAFLTAFKKELMMEFCNMKNHHHVQTPADPIVVLPEQLYYTKGGKVYHLDPLCKKVLGCTAIEKKVCLECLKQYHKRHNGTGL